MLAYGCLASCAAAGQCALRAPIIAQNQRAVRLAALDPECRVIGLISASDVNRLDGFQADFSFLFGAGFADPDHAAALGAGRLFVEDKFDHLAAPKVETSAQPEAFYRGIEDEAREPLWLAVQIDDQGGAPVRRHTPGLVSSEVQNDEPLALLDKRFQVSWNLSIE